MPDWFYRTVSQPILFRLPAPRARDLALAFMGGLARLPCGPFLIDFLGHMRADPRLGRSLLATTFPTAVGLGPSLDPQATALKALSRFGVGFIEIGPVTYEGTTAARPVKRLEFLGTNAATIAAANPRLVPLVAHDRATLGGMLLASGWIFLLSALWGYRRDSAWLWWTLLMGGSIAYTAAIAVHYAVGYLSFKHLLPAFGGFGLLLVGLLLSYPFLCRKTRDPV